MQEVFCWIEFAPNLGFGHLRFALWEVKICEVRISLVARIYTLINPLMVHVVQSGSGDGELIAKCFLVYAQLVMFFQLLLICKNILTDYKIIRVWNLIRLMR